MATQMTIQNFESKINSKVNLIHVFYDQDGYNILFTTNDGNVFGLGQNSNGSCGLGHNIVVKNPSVIPELCLKNIIQIVNGIYFVLALSEDNILYGWGKNDLGQLAQSFISAKDCYLKPHIILSNVNINQISCGYNHCLILTSKDILLSWGDNRYGQTGCGSNNYFISSPTLIMNPDNYKIKTIYCSNNHSFVITTEGLVYSWGYNNWCHLGHELDRCERIFEPKLINIFNVKAVSTSTFNTFFLTNEGLIYFCGNYFKEKNQDIFQIIPKILSSMEEFDCDQFNPSNYEIDCTINSISKGFIYYLISNNCQNSDFKIFTDFYLAECKFSDKVLELNIELLNSISFKDVFTNLSNLSLEYNEEFKELFLYEMEYKMMSFEKKKYINFHHYYLEKYFGYVFITTNHHIGLSNKTLNFKSNIQLDNKISKGISFTRNEYYMQHFEELNHVGDGAFGDVYKVKNKFDKKLYAIKKIICDENKIDSFKHEMFTLAKTSGNFVVRYFDSWMENKSIFIQMEFCPNNLKKILKLKSECFERFEWNDEKWNSMSRIEYFISSQISKELLECVAYLHNSDPPIIHRDLKPDNLLITIKGRNGRFLKLCDFGLATIHGSLPKLHSINKGTINYIAPELRTGGEDHIQYGTEVDIYSIGSILQDIFACEMNKFDRNSISDEYLRTKWSNLFQWIDKMTTTKPIDRPTCDDLIDQFSFWSISKKYVNDFNQNSEIIRNMKSSAMNISINSSFENTYK